MQLCVYVDEGLHCFKGHVGRLEISRDAKGHFGERAPVRVTEVAGMDERERK